ncbi:hypothetical protein QTP88_005687 [Uroleucon formosanum]
MYSRAFRGFFYLCEAETCCKSINNINNHNSSITAARKAEDLPQIIRRIHKTMCPPTQSNVSLFANDTMFYRQSKFSSAYKQLHIRRLGLEEQPTPTPIRTYKNPKTRPINCVSVNPPS